MASSELTSCQDFVILCGLNFTFLVMLSGCSLPERFWQMSYSLMLLQNQPKLQGWKYAHPKSDFAVRLVVIAPHPSNWNTPRVIGLRGNDNTTMWQLVSSIFYHTSQHILWEKRRQTGTSAMNFYRWTCSWFLSPLSSPVQETTESFKIMLR